MKEQYQNAEMEIIFLEAVDIITGSNDLPPIVDDDD